MSDEEESEEETPAVELGAGESVEGVPIARVASRLTWPHEASRIAEREGDVTIRTPDGPRDLASVLEEADESYFDTRQSFVATVQDVVGTGPVPTTD